METIFDLPTHTLVVHAAVVIVPLVAIGAIALAVRPAWRQRLGTWLLGGAAVATVSTVIANRSGEAFDDFTNGDLPVDRHQELAETTTILVIVFFVAVLAFVVVGRRSDRLASADEGTSLALADRSPMALALYGLAALTIVFAVLATVWMIRTGHEGAKATWEPLVEIYQARPS